MFKNKVILITGGSRGLGRALAFAFSNAGAKVAIVGRHHSTLDAAVKDMGQGVLALCEDVADKAAIHRIVGQTAAVLGPIDVLINNASTLGPWGEGPTAQPMPLLLDTDCEALESVLQTNLLAPFRLSKAVLGHMLMQGSGVVVNISSDAAVEPYPRWGAYGASKAALAHLSRILSAEIEGNGVRVLSVDPGEMDTDMHHAALPQADRNTLTQPSVVAARILEVVRASLVEVTP